MTMLSMDEVAQANLPMKLQIYLINVHVYLCQSELSFHYSEMRSLLTVHYDYHSMEQKHLTGAAPAVYTWKADNFV